MFSVIFNFTYRRQKEQHHRWHFHLLTRSLTRAIIIRSDHWSDILGVCPSLSAHIQPHHFRRLVQHCRHWLCCRHSTMHLQSSVIVSLLAVLLRYDIISPQCHRFYTIYLIFILAASLQRYSSGTCQSSMIHLKILTSPSAPPIKLMMQTLKEH